VNATTTHFTAVVLSYLRRADRFVSARDVVRNCATDLSHPRGRVWNALLVLEKNGRVVRVKGRAGTKWGVR
jgi:hypothetical protein